MEEISQNWGKFFTDNYIIKNPTYLVFLSSGVFRGNHIWGMGSSQNKGILGNQTQVYF